MSKLTGTRIYFEHLDVLRCLAAMMVFFAHTFDHMVSQYGYPDFMRIGDSQNLTLVGHYINMILLNGGFGVDVFFLISGFLITYLLLVEKTETGKINIGGFYLRRSFRIWPVYFLIMALAPTLVNWVNTGIEPPYLMTALFLNNFATIKSEFWTYPFAHFWSICVEEHFYLIWPLVVAFVPYKWLGRVFVFVIVTSIISRGLFNHFQWGYYYQYLHTLSRMDALAIGALGAYLHHQKPFVLKFSRYFRLMAYGLFIAMLGYEKYNIYDDMFLVCFRKYFYIGFAAFAMMNFMFHEKPMIRFNGKTFIHYLGKISYGFYMYSTVLLLIIDRTLLPIFPNMDTPISFLLLNFIGSLIISIISYHTMEKMFLKMKTRFEVIRTRN
jgi:peptidoglycan/LPS O-acetylase OafA/YrhL